MTEHSPGLVVGTTPALVVPVAERRARQARLAAHGAIPFDAAALAPFVGAVGVVDFGFGDWFDFFCGAGAALERRQQGREDVGGRAGKEETT